MTFPDYVPDDLADDLIVPSAWFLPACLKLHPQDPFRCVGSIARADQAAAAEHEMVRRLTAEATIVGTFDPERSAWLGDVIGVVPGDRLDTFDCDHLKAAPLPAFRWAAAPSWRNCQACHWDLILWHGLATRGFRCRRCDTALTSDSLRMRALLSPGELMRALVCESCAFVFDAELPRAAGGPVPGVDFYTARIVAREV